MACEWTWECPQGEASQKRKNKYRILMCMCGIQKNGVDYLICKAETETQTQRTNVWIIAVQSFSRVQLLVTPWTAECQASLTFTISLS